MQQEQDPAASDISSPRSLTLDDIREDLRAIVFDSWSKEMRELGAAITRDVRQEVHQCLNEVVRRCCPPRPEKPAEASPELGDCRRPTSSQSHSRPNSSQERRRRSSYVKPTEVPTPGVGAFHVEEPTVSPPVLNVPNTVAHPEDFDQDSSIVDLRQTAIGTVSPGNEFRRSLARSSLVSYASAAKGTSMFPNFDPDEDLDLDWRDKKVSRSGRMLQKKIKGDMSNTHKFNQAMQAELRSLRENKFAMQGRFPFLIRLVSNAQFDYVIFAALALNAGIIGAQVDMLASNIGQDLPDSYRMLNVCFAMLFTAELAIRWIAWGTRFFKMEDWLWNVFDIFAVGFSILDEAAQMFLSGTKTGELIDSMGVLRLLRVGRLARIVRMVRIIPTLKSMVYLIMASMPSFVWTVMLMLMLMYCIAVYYTELATELLRQNLGEPNLAETWGSVGSSIVSLWSAITGGDDWRNFTDTFGDNRFYMVNFILFSVFISFAVLVMLNLVTGVFVDGMQRIIRDDKERELVKTAVTVFTDADLDQNHDLSEEEFADVLDGEAMVDFFLQLGIQADEAGELFHVLDIDSSGTLTMSEFIYGCARLSANARVVDIALCERRTRSLLEEVQEVVIRIVEDLSVVKERLTCCTTASSSPREQQPPTSAPGGYSPKPQAPPCHRFFAERQSLFLQQRYVCEWGMDDADEDAYTDA